MLGLIGSRRLLVFEEGNSDRRIFFRGRHPILVFGGNTQKILSSSAVGGTGRVPGKTGLPISRKNLPSGGLVVISCTTASLDLFRIACLRHWVFGFKRNQLLAGYPMFSDSPE
jgi:hypothetical protein